MNRYIVLIAGLLMMSIPAFSADCTGSKGGAGTDIVGVDGYHYCRSKIRMNWWSAFAWCEGMGKTLVSLEDCNGVDGTLEPSGSSCPNFNGKGSNSFWTSSVPSTTDAYYVEPSLGGGVYSASRANSSYALCK